MFDITICNNDVQIGHTGFLNQHYLMLDTYIATVHNAREEFNDNLGLNKIKYHTSFRLSILNFNFPEDTESSPLLYDANPSKVKLLQRFCPNAGAKVVQGIKNYDC